MDCYFLVEEGSDDDSDDFVDGLVGAVKVFDDDDSMSALDGDR